MKTVFSLSILLHFCFSPVQANEDVDAARKIDQILAKHWKEKGVKASPFVDDATFVRRTHLDIIGRIPTGIETKKFIEDGSKDKRIKLIDSLLSSEGYVNHQFNFWADILRIHSNQGGGQQIVPGYIQFVKSSVRENKPYDEFVREMLTAEGVSYENGAIGYYYRDRGMPLDNMANTVRIFLGTRLECAQCHNHPFDKWTQKDFFHMAAFSFGMSQQRQNQSRARMAYQKMQKDKTISRDDRRNLQQAFQEIGRPLRNSVSIAYQSEKLPRLPHDYQYQDAKPKQTMTEKVMFGDEPEIVSPNDRLDKYAEWMTSKENPRFTTVIANRLWKRVFGMGMIEPVDELIDATVPAIPELMAFLENEMKARDYDLKSFQRMLFLTEVYQREAGTPAAPIPATYPFTGPVMRRMSAEQIWDSLVTMVNPAPEIGDWKRQEEAKLRNINSSLLSDALNQMPDQELIKKVKLIAQSQKKMQQRLRDLQEQQAEARKEKDREKIQKFGREVGKLRNDLRREVYDKVYRPALKKVKPKLITVNFPEGEMMTMKMTPADVSFTGNPPRELINQIAEKEAAIYEKESEEFGISDKEKRNYINFRRGISRNYLRAANLSSPAQPGHFLRQFGQSDRETIENAESAASVPQALTMMNSSLFETLTNRNSVLRRTVSQIEKPAERAEMIYLSILNRKPTSEEMEIVRQEAENRKEEIFLDLVFALLNNQEFFFIK